MIMELSAVAPVFNPHLKTVLQSFQSAAERSLNGPQQQQLSPDSLADYSKSYEMLRKAGFAANKATDTASPPFALTLPIFIPTDRGQGEKSETELEGERIACFVVGGEQRLCLPQILNTVLREFTLQQINAVCDDLHIFCSRCNPEQLEVLKLTGVLPLSAPSCGLITKTDALRLCNALLHCSAIAERASDMSRGKGAFLVYHECFGKCKGVFSPELYTKEDAGCIECTECLGLFSPLHFVCHSHKSQENRTCHWGFDTANWRSYLLLAKDQESDHSMQKALDAMKARFDPKALKKRESNAAPASSEGSKRPRYEATSSSSEASSSAFRPWSPTALLKEGKSAVPAFLQRGPPVLLNPESVVPFKDTKHYDRHFAPNVSLAPQPKEECKPEEEDMEESPTAAPGGDQSATAVRGSSEAQSSVAPARKVPSLTHEHERHLVMLREALDGEVDDHEAFVGEFIALQARQEEKFRDVLLANFDLRKEVEALRRSQKESSDESASKAARLERSLEQADREHSAQLRQLAEDRSRLSRELDAAKQSHSRQVQQVRDELGSELERAQARVSQQETLQAQMAEELNKLREQLAKLQPPTVTSTTTDDVDVEKMEQEEVDVEARAESPQ